MEHHAARRLAKLLREYLHEKHRYSVEEHALDQGTLSGFHQWADSRPCEGAFLVRAPNNTSVWLVIVDWKRSSNFYVVLFPESKAGPIAELHEWIEEDEELTLRWTYSPTKRDGKNQERKAYFQEAFLSTDVSISLPSTKRGVGDFLAELFTLAESRRKADDLDEDRPALREGFPEGKLKERLHLARERSPEVVRQAKQLALQRYGTLRCACCGFDFAATYGRIGEGFIEAHHTKPVSTLHRDGEITRVEDIALVCANCHRMLHRRRPWLSIHELPHLSSDG